MAKDKDVYSIGFGQSQDALTTKVGGVEFNSAATYGGENGTKQVDNGSPMRRFMALMQDTHKKTQMIMRDAAKGEGKEELVYGKSDASLADKEAKKANIISRTVWGKFGEGKDEKTLVSNMSTMSFGNEDPSKKYIDLSKSSNLAVPTAGADGVKLEPGKSGGAIGVRNPVRVTIQAIGEYDPANPTANKEDVGRMSWTPIESTNGLPVYAASRKPGASPLKVDHYEPAMSGKPKFELPMRDKEGNIVKNDKGATKWREVSVDEFMKEPRIAETLRSAEKGLKGETIEKNIKQPDNTVKPEQRPAGGFTSVGSYDTKVNEEVLTQFAKRTLKELGKDSAKVAMSKDKDREGAVKIVEQNVVEREDGTKGYEAGKGISVKDGVVKEIPQEKITRGGVNATITKRERKDVDVNVDVGENGGGGSSSPAPKTTRKRDTGIGR